MEREAQIQFLLDHYQRPRHAGHLKAPNAEATWGNPGCGDIVHIELRIEKERITEIAHTATGCTVSRASASILSQWAHGKHIQEVLDFTPEMLMDLLGRGIVLQRPRCATVALEALRLAIRRYQQERRGSDA